MFERPPSSKAHIVIVAGDEGVLCMPYNIPGAPAPFFAAAADKLSATAILAIVGRYPHVPVTLLADNLAQDIRRDAVPRLNPFDRSKLIRRRLQQAFPQARLSASVNLKSDRKQVLLAGLHDGGATFDWLARLSAVNPTNPPRIALLPVECMAMVARLLPQAASDWGMLISLQRTGGFRQIVTYMGELIFTRLTPPLPAGTTHTEIAGIVARDIEASRGYLGRLGLADHAALPTAIFIPKSCHASLHAVLPAAVLLTPYDAASRLGLSFAPAADDPFGDLLFALWLAQKKKPAMVLMPPELQSARRTAAVRRWGLRTATAALVFAFGLAAWDTGDLFTTLLAGEKESAQLSAVETTIARERAEAEPATEPLGRLRQALERQRVFAMETGKPWLVLQELDRALGDEARLVKLTWQNDSGKPQDEVLLASARLTQAPDIADRETTVARFKKLAEEVSRTMPHYSVEVTRYPFPALPHEALSNNAPEDKNADPSAEFSVRRAP